MTLGDTAEPSGEWPADAGSIAAARNMLSDVRGTVVVACDNDVDGLAAAVILQRVIGAAGAHAVVMPARRGEHVHRESMRLRILAERPRTLVVADMGSRPAPIIPELPTLVIDHHNASAGRPPGTLFVNGYDRPPVATSSVLAYAVCRPLAGAEEAGWLAALGAVADLGSAGAFRAALGLDARGASWRRAVSLLNAARRAPDPDPLAALQVLQRSSGVGDIVSAHVPGVERLEHYRQQVRHEVDRCSRVAPLLLGPAAVLRCSSSAQVHPMVAMRWARRLSPRIVIAANDGFLPGRVNFAVRSAEEMDLLSWLRRLPLTLSDDAEYANGHARATGGSLPADEFDRFLEAVAAAPPAEPTRAALEPAPSRSRSRPHARS
jgi:single-stranded-DNA-specific exonuclease